MTRKWYATLCHPKMYPNTKFGIPSSKNIGHMDRTRKRDGLTDSAITICLPKFLWGHNKVSKTAIDELLKRGYDSLAALRLVNIEDLSSQNIPVGQRRLLVHITHTLGAEDSTSSATGNSVTTTSASTGNTVSLTTSSITHQQVASTQLPADNSHKPAMPTARSF